MLCSSKISNQYFETFQRMAFAKVRLSVHLYIEYEFVISFANAKLENN